MSNQFLGIAFWLLAAVLTFLMFYLWGFPFNKAAHKSEAPPALMRLHRFLGYAYLLIYVYLMWDMLPRLWTYQIELPARTVAHLLLGMTIGSILVVKISIVRFFKHLEPTLVPLLGTSLFVCTSLLIALALPTQLRESFLSDFALEGDGERTERIDRVRELLPEVGLEDEDLLAELTTPDGLVAGRRVLTTKCVQCHDLRTVLARPRTPQSWRQTVERMSSRSTVLSPISEAEQWAVTAYLVAISPTLQRSLMKKRAQDMAGAASRKAVSDAGSEMRKMGDSYDAAAAKSGFETRCSQCHSHVLVEGRAFSSPDEVVALVTRMVTNGLVATDGELAQIMRYLTETYVPGGAEAMRASAGPAVATDAGVIPSDPAGESTPTVLIRPGGGLDFETASVTAGAGPLTIVLQNDSGLEHNFLLLREERFLDDVASAAAGRFDYGHVPDHEGLLAAIPALAPGGRAETSIDGIAPGTYRFLCAMPGHSFTMRGTLEVTE